MKTHVRTSRGPWRAVAAACLLGASALASASCNFAVADIPDSAVVEKPVWRDVKVVFEDHCTLCHGAHANYGAPADFRLDVYGDDPAAGIAGAGATSGVAFEIIDEGEMPPAAAWGDGVGPNGKELLRRWVDQNAFECYVDTDCETGQRCIAAGQPNERTCVAAPAN